MMPNTVKARPAGWNHAAVENDSDQPDPTVPTLTGYPEWVTGPLTTREVTIPAFGSNPARHYVRHEVNGVLVDPTTIMPV
jgi:hypothetical protein